MSRLAYARAVQTIYFIDDRENIVASYDCHSDFEEGYNEEGEPRETLPNGTYTVTAEEPPAENAPEFGTFYIITGDPRGRDIHGGGSSLDDPYAPYQGWLCTYGCLRMQNADGEELSRLIIEDGNNLELEVSE